eukprot:CAMPEP_0177775480 /NCGR_PEP_ID=MMETSP0491_2-20121128/14145_1 /TAXON_ID=63592 /ORGANISM="Tetraselmis chuii, Strain PLY429" /LENGTH=49 /DNA_ID= /DNA_START= /DNA_END= /DNA_ORIENTATION=
MGAGGAPSFPPSPPPTDDDDDDDAEHPHRSLPHKPPAQLAARVTRTPSL